MRLRYLNLLDPGPGSHYQYKHHLQQSKQENDPQSMSKIINPESLTHHSNHIPALPENHRMPPFLFMPQLILSATPIFSLSLYLLAAHRTLTFRKLLTCLPVWHMHILDFLILIVKFLCIIHSHSSDRRRPTRNTLTLGISHLVSTRKPSHLSAQQPKQDSPQTLHQPTPNHARHRTQPRTTQPQVSMWHMPQGSYIKPVRGCVRHLQHLASHHLHAHVINHLRIAPQHLLALYLMQHLSSHKQPP